MNKVLIFLILAFLLFSCKESPHIEVSPGEIVSLQIEDFNWELGRTNVYQISKEKIVVFEKNMPTKILEEFSLDIDNEVWKAINEIDEIYTVNMTDKNVQDGTSLSFIFTLANNTTHKVNVSNLIIRPYARVTKIISDLLKSEIHYHQYNSRVY